MHGSFTSNILASCHVKETPHVSGAVVTNANGRLVVRGGGDSLDSRRVTGLPAEAPTVAMERAKVSRKLIETTAQM